MLASTGLMPPTCASRGVPSCPRMPMSMLRAERTGPIRAEVLALEHGGEAGDAALDGLLEDDVGLVQARLGAAGRVVVDLDRHGGSLRDGAAGRRFPGQGAGGWRRRRGRRGRLRLGRRLVGRGGGAGAQEQPGEPGGRQHAPGARVSHPGTFGLGFRHRWASIVRGPGPESGGIPVAAGRAARLGRAENVRRRGCRRRFPPLAAAPGVDVRPVPARTAVRGGRTQAEAAVDVLHGAADHVGHAREWRGTITLGGMAPVFPSSDTKLAEPLASTPPPLPGAV